MDGASCPVSPGGLVWQRCHVSEICARAMCVGRQTAGGDSALGIRLFCSLRLANQSGGLWSMGEAGGVSLAFL
jgi:hypothetical protein